MGCLTFVVTWKHYIDVGVIEWPEAFSHVKRVGIDRGNDENFAFDEGGIGEFMLTQKAHQLRCNPELIDSSAHHWAYDNATRRRALSSKTKNL